MITLQCEWKDAPNKRSSALRAIGGDPYSAIARVWHGSIGGAWYTSLITTSETCGDREPEKFTHKEEAQRAVERLLGVKYEATVLDRDGE